LWKIVSQRHGQFLWFRKQLKMQQLAAVTHRVTHRKNVTHRDASLVVFLPYESDAKPKTLFSGAFRPAPALF
jgi:hypothetical protein